MLRIENDMKQSCSGRQCFVCSAVGYRSVVIFSLGSRAERKAVQAPTVAAKGYEIDVKLVPSHCVLRDALPSLRLLAHKCCRYIALSIITPILGTRDESAHVP
jgi:hypothetical protein